MSKFTPGPWRMDGGGDRHTSIAAQESLCIADVWWINVTEQEALANARLIAAAPDLLAALYNMLEDGDKTDREQALTAIKRATQ